jgi:hypothetical protein
MSNHTDSLVSAEPSPSCAAPATNLSGGSLEHLACLAGRTGVQDDILTHPDKVVLRFMDDFVAPVREWCQAYSAKVQKCYIAADGQHPAVFVIGTAPGYDYTLSQPLAALERDLYRSGWRCSVLQLPSDEPSTWKAFFHEPEAIQVFPHATQPSHAER